MLAARQLHYPSGSGSGPTAHAQLAGNASVAVVPSPAPSDMSDAQPLAASVAYQVGCATFLTIRTKFHHPGYFT